jgi:hypothetical protein
MADSQEIPEKKTPAQRPRGDERQRRAGVAEIAYRDAAQSLPDHPARPQRQRGLVRVKAQGFERAAGDEQHDETGHDDVERPAVRRAQPVQPAVAPPDHRQQEDHPPPRRKAKNIEQEIGDPRAAAPGRIVQDRHRDGVRPPRIGAVESPQRKAKESRQRDQGQPARLLEDDPDLLRERARGRGAGRIGIGGGIVQRGHHDPSCGAKLRL